MFLAIWIPLWIATAKKLRKWLERWDMEQPKLEQLEIEMCNCGRFGIGETSIRHPRAYCQSVPGFPSSAQLIREIGDVADGDALCGCGHEKRWHSAVNTRCFSPAHGGKCYCSGFLGLL